MIKLSTTPINRRYWINSDVVYKIENKNLGDGGAITSETVNTDGTITYGDSNDMLPSINLYKTGSSQSDSTLYLDTFIEVGDKWNITNGTVTKNDVVTDIYIHFINKCKEEIGTLIKNKPQLTVQDFEDGRYDNVVPSWVLSTNLSFEMYKKGEKNNTNKIDKIDINTILNDTKKNIIKDEIEKTFNTLKTKYGLLANTNICDFIDEVFNCNPTESEGGE